MTPTPTENSEIHIRSVGVNRQGIDGNASHLHVPIKDASKKKTVLNDLRAVDTKEFAKEYEAAYEPPTFTIKELRDAIPPHLFEKNILISSAYVIVNLMICFALFYVATLFDRLLPTPLLFLAWPLYWWFQGVAATGIWVLAHECGHQSFSNSKEINNAVGLVLHSLLLVPYHPWRITHAQHHASTAHIGQDQVFVPKRRSEIRPNDNNNDEVEEKKHSAWEEALEDAPLYNFLTVATYLVFGWPAYLFAHKSGQQYPVQTNHFVPSSPIFEKRHRGQVLLSDAGLVAVVGAIAYAVYATSFWTVSKYYLIPYLFVNGWLVTITLLQHTDVYLPHYTPKSWNFVRGALTTVDRDYGWFLNHALHHIQDSHVAHHLFSQMPHYNAIKATPYLKEKLGQYYLYDKTPVFKALMRAAAKCVFVEDTGDILFYRNK